MGDLRDQLKKAKLLSDKEARRLAHEQRVERKEKGREGLEQEQQQRQQEIRHLQESQRERTKAEQQALEREQKAREEQAAVATILKEQARKAGPGSVKWYFETPDGDLPFLEVSPQELNQLRAGMLCVLRLTPGTHDYRVLPTELTRRVAKQHPELVVHAPRGTA